MSVHKLKSERKHKSAFIIEPRTLSLQEQEELQEEIDTLALLLNEVKKQIEKIEAAADAIGDAMLFHKIEEPAHPGEQMDPRRRKGVLQMPKLSRSRTDARSSQQAQM